MALKIIRKVGKNAHGQSSSDVKTIQMCLAAIKNKKYKPCYAGKIDGKAGPKTLQAICDFQAENKIKVTGVVETHGPTINAMNRKMPHSVKDSLSKAAAGGSAAALTGSNASGTNITQKIKQQEAKIKQQNDKLAREIMQEWILPDQEAKDLSDAIKELSTKLLVPLESANGSNPMDAVTLDREGRFCVSLKICDWGLAATGPERHKDITAMTKTVCDCIAKKASWSQGSTNDLHFKSVQDIPDVRKVSSADLREQKAGDLKNNETAQKLAASLSV